MLMIKLKISAAAKSFKKKICMLNLNSMIDVPRKLLQSEAKPYLLKPNT